MQLIHVCVYERERERLQRSPTCTSSKCCGFPLNCIPTCAYTASKPITSHHSLYCIGGLPQGDCPQVQLLISLGPLVGGPAMVMKPSQIYPNNISLEGGARTYIYTHTHTHTHTHSLTSSGQYYIICTIIILLQVGFFLFNGWSHYVSLFVECLTLVLLSLCFALC